MDVRDPYEQKLEELEKYLPFLENVITKLRTVPDKTRAPQLDKLQSLYNIVINSRKNKLKYDTLIKCEEGLKKLHDKVGKSDLKKFEKPGYTSAPASPSPPASPEPMLVKEPILIPTSPVRDDKTLQKTEKHHRRNHHHHDKSDKHRDKHRKSHSKREHVDIYSKGILFKEKKDDSTLLSTLPLSKPPLSTVDLESLLAESDAAKDPTSLEIGILENIREQLRNEITQLNEPGTPPNEVNNPTVSDLRQRTSDVLNKFIKSEPKGRTNEIKTCHSKHKTTQPFDVASPKRNEKFDGKDDNLKLRTIKEENNIFGNLLSSIDEQIIDKTKSSTKKGDEKLKSPIRVKSEDTSTNAVDRTKVTDKTDSSIVLPKLLTDLIVKDQGEPVKTETEPPIVDLKKIEENLITKKMTLIESTRLKSHDHGDTIKDTRLKSNDLEDITKDTRLKSYDRGDTTKDIRVKSHDQGDTTNDMRGKSYDHGEVVKDQQFKSYDHWGDNLKDRLKGLDQMGIIKKPDVDQNSRPEETYVRLSDKYQRRPKSIPDKSTVTSSGHMENLNITGRGLTLKERERFGALDHPTPSNAPTNITQFSPTELHFEHNSFDPRKRQRNPTWMPQTSTNINTPPEIMSPNMFNTGGGGKTPQDPFACNTGTTEFYIGSNFIQPSIPAPLINYPNAINPTHFGAFSDSPTYFDSSNQYGQNFPTPLQQPLQQNQFNANLLPMNCHTARDTFQNANRDPRTAYGNYSRDSTVNRPNSFGYTNRETYTARDPRENYTRDPRDPRNPRDPRRTTYDSTKHKRYEDKSDKANSTWKSETKFRGYDPRPMPRRKPEPEKSSEMKVDGIANIPTPGSLQSFKIPKIKREEKKAEEKEDKGNEIDVQESKEETAEKSVEENVSDNATQNPEITSNSVEPIGGKSEEKSIKNKEEFEDTKEAIENFVRRLCASRETDTFFAVLEKLGETLKVDGLGEKLHKKRTKCIIESDSDESDEESAPLVKKETKKSKNQQEKVKKENPVKEQSEEDEEEEQPKRRTRSKTRNITTPSPSEKPQKVKKARRRNSLDMLQEDLRDMFICKGELTVTGKKMCSLLKNQEKFDMDDDISTRTRRRKDISEEECSSRRTRQQGNQCKEEIEPKKRIPKVVLEKTELSLKDNFDVESTTTEKKKLVKKSRGKVKVNFSNAKKYNIYLKRNLKKCNQKKRKKSSSTRLKNTKIKYVINALIKRKKIVFNFKTLDEIFPKDIETEDESIVSNDNDESKVKRNVGKRKKRKRMYKKNVKRLKKEEEVEKEPPTVTEEDDQAEEKLDDVEVPIENIDKSYCITANERYPCKLCSFTGKTIVLHYKTVHPTEEVFISRLPEDQATLAVEQSVKENYDQMSEQVEELIKGNTVRRKRFSGFQCRLCHLKITDDFTEAFFNHISSHTGEYRYGCTLCTFASYTLTNVRSHSTYAHNQNHAPQLFYPACKNVAILFGYLCGECNYVQLHRENVVKHAEKYHNRNEKIYKINLSELEKNMITDRISYESLEKSSLTKKRKDIETVEEDNNTSLEVDQKIEETLVTDVSNKADSKTDEVKESKPTSDVVKGPKITPDENFKTTPDEEVKELNITPDEMKKLKTSPNKVKELKITAGVMKESKTTSTDVNESNESDEVKKVEQKNKMPNTRKKKVEEKEKDLNIFVSSADFLDEQRIQDERLKKMQEVVEAINQTRRTSLQFLDTLKLKIESSKSTEVESAPVQEISEPIIESEALSQSTNQEVATDPLQLESEDIPKETTTATGDVPPLNQSESSPESIGELSQILDDEDIDNDLINDVLSMEHDWSKWTSSPNPNKKDTTMMNTIQRLVNVVKSNSDTTILPNEDTTELTITPKVEQQTEKKADELFKLCGITIIQKPTALSELPQFVFHCSINNCSFTTESDMDFAKHITTTINHNDFWDGECSYCHETIQKDRKLHIIDAFDHLIDEHMPKTPVLKIEIASPLIDTEKKSVIRVRKLSGDRLICSDDSEKKLEATPASNEMGFQIKDVFSLNAMPDETSQPPKGKGVNVSSPDTKTMPGPLVPLYMICPNDATANNKYRFKITPKNKERVIAPKLVNATSVMNSVSRKPSISSWATQEVVDSQAVGPQIVGSQTVRQQTPQYRHVTIPKLDSLLPPVTKSSNYTNVNYLTYKETSTILKMLEPMKLCHLYKCPQSNCIFSSDSSSAFIAHLKNHFNKNELRSSPLPYWVACLYCKALGHVAGNLKTAKDLQQHILIEHGECLFQCAYCFYRVAAQSLVERHQEQYHPKEQICVYFISPRTDYNEYNKQLPLRLVCMPYICPFESCQKHFYIRDNFVDHIQNQHPDVDAYDCRMCNEKRNTPIGLVQHYIQRHNIGFMQCLYCEYSAEYEQTMRSHTSVAHPNQAPKVLIRQLNPAFQNVGVTEPSIDSQIFQQLNIVNLDINLKHASKPIAVPRCETDIPWMTTSSSEISDTTSSIDIPTNELKTPSLKPPPVEPTVNASSTTTSPQVASNVAIDIPIIDLDGSDIDELDKPDDAQEITSNIDPLNVEDRTTQIESTKETGPPIKSGAICAGKNVILVKGPPQTAEAIPDTVNNDEEDCHTPTVRTVNDIMHTGLWGKQLYRCGATNCGFASDSLSSFKDHLFVCDVSGGDGSIFKCYHCKKMIKQMNTLIDHVKRHGIARYGCSLCYYRGPVPQYVAKHMKDKHRITTVRTIPLDPYKSDPEMDLFIVCPQGKSVSLKRKDSQKDLSSETAMVFAPTEIDLLPRQPISQFDLKCSQCSYQTKVRTNMVRHLLFHTNSVPVPESAPVNPVPCLEKNEKMFDKMVNLANSSFTETSRMGGRMGGDKNSKKKEGSAAIEDADLPGFIPEAKRFVCGADGCVYLTVNDSLLIRHFRALHSEETNFKCPHCKTLISLDKITIHLKMHDNRLYKCSHCLYYHYQKHFVERHLVEKHPEKAPYVHVVREADKETTDKEEDTTTEDPRPEQPSDTVLKETKPWRCGLCKYRGFTRLDVSDHAKTVHNVRSQFMCSLCQFRCNIDKKVESHFKTVHTDQKIDIISVIYKDDQLENETAHIEPDAFDTTPLWRRDMPRVRHIRGILFEETRGPRKSKSDTTKVEMNETDEPLLVEKVKKTDVVRKRRLTVSADTVQSGEISEVGGSEAQADISDVSEKEKKPELARKRRLTIAVDTPQVEETSLVKCQKDVTTASADNCFRCSACNDFNTESKKKFAEHLCKEMNYEKFICTYCSKKSYSMDYMKNHLVNDHGKPWKQEYIVTLTTDVGIESFIMEEVNSQGKKIYGDSYTVVQNLSALLECDLDARQATAKKADYNVESDSEQNEDADDKPLMEKRLRRSLSSKENTFIDPKQTSKNQCPHCPYYSKFPRDVTKHIVRHWSEEPFKCGHCDFKGYRDCDIKQHSSVMHPTKRIDVVSLCDIKDVKIRPVLRRQKTLKDDITADNLLQPSTSSSGDGTTLITEEDFEMLDDIESSVADQAGVTYKCHYCPKTGDNLKVICDHWKAVHKDRIKNCFFQFKKTSTESMPIRGRYRCEQCGFRGSKLNVYQHHKQAHQGTVPRYTVSGSKNLTPNTKLSCKFCTYICYTESIMRTHYETQHPLENYPEKDVTYKCKWCAKICANKLDAYNHHTGFHSHLAMSVVPITKSDSAESCAQYCCPNCSHKSGSYIAIQQHLKTHVAIYKCTQCDLCFTFPRLVKAHFSKLHPGLAQPAYEISSAAQKELFAMRKKLTVLLPDKTTIPYNEYRLQKEKKRKASSHLESPNTKILKISDQEDSSSLSPPKLSPIKLLEPSTSYKSSPVAKKSTTFIPKLPPFKPRSAVAKKSTTQHVKVKAKIEPYSFYGTKNSYDNSNITTTMYLSGTQMRVNLKTLMALTNIFPSIRLVDLKTQKMNFKCQ